MRWGLSTVTASSGSPVTKEEFKLHHRISGNDEDQYIDSLLRRAMAYCEAQTEKTFLPTVLRLTMDRFPLTDQQYIYMPRPPLVSVSTASYVEPSSGTSTALASSDYTVDTYSLPGRIEPVYNTAWPATREQVNAVTIQYTAGYGATNAAAIPLVPERIKQAILMLASHWYENRESEGDVPMGITHLLSMESAGTYTGAVG